MSLAVDDMKANPTSNSTAKSLVSYMPHASFKPSPLNPRKQKRDDATIAELAQSIDDKGLLHNLVARKAKDGKLEIAAGEGRWLAIGKLIASGKWSKDRLLPVQIRELTDAQMIEVGLIENVQRADLHPLDEGAAYRDLYDLALKSAGKNAAANVVRDLAKRIDKTERYVQKRIALVRDLAPDVSALFAKNEIDLATAQLFASVPAKRQEKVLKERDQENARAVEHGRLDDVRPLTAGGVMHDLRDDMRDLEAALFDRKLYTGATTDHRGKLYAVDAKTFDQLQKKAVGDLTASLKADAKAGKIAFFETGDYFHRRDWNADADPKGGVYLEVKRSWHKGPTHYRLFRGLVKTKAAIEHEKSQARWRAQVDANAAARTKARATEKAKTTAEPRIALVADYVATSPATYLALEIYSAIHFDVGDFDDGIEWYQSYSNISGAQLLDRLKDLGKPPSGQKLLPWLLQQSFAALAKIYFGVRADRSQSWFKRKWRRPDKQKVGAAEQALFDACGAKLPEAKTKAPAAKKKTARK